MRPRRRVLAFVDIAVVVGIVWLAYLALPYGIRMRATQGIDRPFDEMRFDQGAWISKEPWREHAFSDKEPMRALMVKDLVRRHLHAGMSRSEVRHLLGAPDTEAGTIEAPVWEYELGSWGHRGVSDHELTILFTKGGRVVRSTWD